jgi:hypothetical protein
MMLSDPILGNPPAVPDDMVAAWQKLADDIDDALAMGGEPGLELLLALMPEWRDAVADVNAARMTCARLIRSGYRDESFQWHADGFDEVAERLAPERPGWEAWEQALEERGVAVPRIDMGLKDAVDSARADLNRKDATGRSLADMIDMLRGSVLAHGPLGERLTILEAIRRLDPASPAWGEMIGPIRRQRAEEITDEIREAITREDRLTLERLKREVETTEWLEGMPQAVPNLLAAVVGIWRALDLRRPLEAAAGAIPAHASALQSADWRHPTYDRVVGEAMMARETFLATRASYEEAMQTAMRLPETGAWATRARLAEAVRKTDAAVQDGLAVLDGQQRFAKTRASYVELEVKIHELVEQAPLHGGTWDEIKNRGRRWLDGAAKAVAKANQLQSRSRTEMPRSTGAALDRLKGTREQVHARVKRVETWEWRVTSALLGLVGGVALLLIGTLIVSALRN